MLLQEIYYSLQVTIRRIRCKLSGYFEGFVPAVVTGQFASLENKDI